MDFRNRIRSAIDRRSEPLVVPEWGITEADGCTLFGLTAEQRGKLEKLVTDVQQGKRDGSDVQAWAIVFSAHGPHGVPLLESTDVPMLKGKDAAVISRLFKDIAALSGLSQDAVSEAKEELKNGQTSALLSSSPAT